MDEAGIDLAVVTSIVGTHRERVTIIGTQNHAGTTPFRLRHDAGRAAARAAADLRGVIQAVDGDATANIGWIRFDPGGINVIPGRAAFTLDVRHVEDRVVRQAVDAFHDRLSAICSDEGCQAGHERLAWTAPAPMDPLMIETVEQACAELGSRPAKLWSGAGHDAMILSHHVPTGMLFVPSLGGISHAPQEATSDAHLVLGARALLRAVRLAAARIK